MPHFDPNPKADKLIDEGASIRALRPCFDKRYDAILYFAQRQSSLHKENQKKCCDCGQASLYQGDCQWQARFRERWAPQFVDLLWLILGFIRISYNFQVSNFLTRHGFCNGCWKRYQMRRGLAKVFEFIGTFTGAISLFLVMFGFFGYLYFRNDPRNADFAAMTLKSFIVGVVVMVLSVLLLKWSQKFGLPPAIKPIARSPYICVGIEKAPF